LRLLGGLGAALVSWTCSVYEGSLLPGAPGSDAGGDTTSNGGSGATAGLPTTTGGAGGAKGTTDGGTPTTTAGHGGSGGANTAGVGGSQVPITDSAGAGGQAVDHCSPDPIPLKGSWKADASDAKDPVDNLMDLSTARWTTGKPQDGTEWFEIDFGTSAAVREISMTRNDDDDTDYPRQYEVRLSDTAHNMEGPVVASGMGALGMPTVVTFDAPIVGRYLLVRQTGKDPTQWWSIAELYVKCY
jgi:hypothetical protein